MTMQPVGLHAALVFTALAMGTVLVAPNAGAGIRDSLENVRDAVGCTGKAVFNPMRVLKWGMKNFERLSGQEYERKADQSIGDALEECREAAGNIFARAFGVDEMVESVRDQPRRAREIANAARRARDRVSDWFRGDAGTPADRRVALSVTARERDFYEKEAGVLDDRPLPAVSGWEARDEPPSGGGRRAQRRGADSAARADPWSDDDGTAPSPRAVPVDATGKADDPWSDAGASTEHDPWSRPDSGDSEPWRRDDAHRNSAVGASDAGELPEDGGVDPIYAAALAEALGGSAREHVTEDDYERALAALYRNEAEARDAAETEPQRAEREAETEPVTSPGSAGGVDSSSCQDLTPTCLQVMATIKGRVAPINARVAAGGLSMSELYALGAEMYKVYIDLLPTCYATETRPHCQAANQRDLEEIRRAYESARRSERQARGG